MVFPSLRHGGSTNGETGTGVESNAPLTARKYRSKRQRPCDLCRRRKTVCKVLLGSGVCELCKKLGKRCAFVLQPLRKQQPRPLPSEGHLQTNPSQDQRASENTPENLVRCGACSIANGPVDIAFDVDMFLVPPATAQTPTFNHPTASLNTIEWPFLESFDTHVEDGNDFESQPSVADSRSQAESLSPVQQGNRDERQCLNDASAVGRRQSDFHEYAYPAVSDDVSSTPSDGDWPEGFSLDTRRGYSTQLIGLSNETDPFLLRHFQYDMFDNYTMRRLIYRKMTDEVTVKSHINSSTAGGTPKIPTSEVPIHFQVFDNSICDENVKAIERDFSVYNYEAEDCDQLYKIVPRGLDFQLLNLFFKFVQPSYPVFSARDYERFNTDDGYDLPMGLKAAMYALAMPFYFLDDQLCMDKGYVEQPPTDGLWGIAQRSLQCHFQKPHLWLVQLCLLLLQRPPANFAVGDLPGLWALSCSALAAAESLGLHLDPSKWRLPRWEVRLRKRLWWIVYSDHTWRALVSGRPSHLRSDSWIVPKLRPEDLEADEYRNVEVGNVIRKQNAYLLALCDLSVIADDILTNLYSARAVCEANTLPEILARAQPLRARLREWQHSVFGDQATESDSGGFRQNVHLRVALMTLEVLLFRAILRALVFPPASGYESYTQSQFELLQDSQSCAESAVELISLLTPKHFVDFWPSYARYYFAYISTFILLLFMQSPSMEMASQNKALLEKLREIIRAQARAWPVLKLAAIRLDAIFFAGLEKVVNWVGMDSPAQILLIQ